MEITHELLESLLKKTLDKLKFQLCLKFENDSYDIQLKDSLPYNAMLINGDIVTIKIKTQLFTEVMTKKSHGNEFRQLLESCLRAVPKMRTTLTHNPTADLLVYDYEKSKFTKYSKAEYERENPPHPFEKEIHYNTDFRTTAIHWKSGIVIREHAKSSEASLHNARRKILMILSDPEIYRREDDKFLSVESHEDIIYDLVVQSKVLNKQEIEQLIEKLKNGE